MTDPMRTGYEAFTAHSNCALYNGYVPARGLSGAEAIKFHLPPEAQDAFQFARPHDEQRVQWMHGWDQARADVIGAP